MVVRAAGTFFRGIVLAAFGQIGRVGGGDTRSAHGLFAMSLGESRVRQTGPRLEERGRAAAGVVDVRHGGATLLADLRRGCGRGGGTARGVVRIVFLG